MMCQGSFLVLVGVVVEASVTAGAAAMAVDTV